MSPGRSGAAGEAEIPVAVGAPHHVAVVNDELYAAVYVDMEVKKACGDRLIVIGGRRTSGDGFIELNSWVPK
ncbi:hypothetical protein Golob_028026 [Gossypium lobatum]|uniref:Uncharacterized protein n=1 Tax=Gossypium lobatum TaxID=34289 RepID=A0A7J8ND43_9ROSI|nr:hypothetical protein [Gossypium lobatum]